MGHLLKSQLAHKMTPCVNISAKDLRDQKVLDLDKGRNKKYLQHLQKLLHQKELHNKSYSNV